MVWQEPRANTYTLNGQRGHQLWRPRHRPQPGAPRPEHLRTASATRLASLDWRYSWMFTGQLTNAGNASCFDGNIVIFENRPFGIQAPAKVPYPPGGVPVLPGRGRDGRRGDLRLQQHDRAQAGPGYGSAADRTVLLRWPDSDARPGRPRRRLDRRRDLRATAVVVYNPTPGTGRFLNGAPVGSPNPANNFEWDNMPAQRCYWYQVQKIAAGDRPIPPSPASFHDGLRQPVAGVPDRLDAGPTAQPVYLNAALIAPNVVNVIPQTIFTFVRPSRTSLEFVDLVWRMTRDTRRWAR